MPFQVSTFDEGNDNIRLFRSLSLNSVSGLNCYQCDSNVDLECNEEFDGDSTQLRPLSCDHIHEARFCTKTTGMYAGRAPTEGQRLPYQDLTRTTL